MTIITKKLNICIVSHNAYGMMTGGNTGHAGGVENQTTMMSKWLASRGHKVSLLTWDEGQDDVVDIDGVLVIKMCRKDAGMHFIRFIHPRWTSLYKALKLANAELYYQNCAEYVTGQIALWCKYHKRVFIYSVASDTECELVSPNTKKFRDRIFYRYGIKNANRIIVQTVKQQQMLIKNFNLESIVLPMPCQGPTNGEYEPPYFSDISKKPVLWVGRLDKEKRLELLLDVAEDLPNISFHIAGKPSNPKEPYVKHLFERAKKISNIRMLGMITKKEMSELYKSSSILCCTSIYEGFPNTFLEAWSYGIPIVSTIDPDNIIVSRKLGLFAEGKEDIKKSIKTLLENIKLYKEMSSNARQYFEKFHSYDKAMERFENLFLMSVRF